MTYCENERVYFSSDYMEGAHPSIIEALARTNMEHCEGYGEDPHTEHAKEMIREICQAPDAYVQFLVGGTQTNATVIDAMLRGYEGVISASSGHINVHEAGAIEFGGHRVLALPDNRGKINAEQIRHFMDVFEKDGARDHLVQPGMVYLSLPTEYGTLYSLEELKAISSVCGQYDLKLYIDGARLAYALASPANDITMADLASYCDAFYIGGTKCGALFGEAVVIPDKKLLPHFFTTVKQHGALLAKGRLLGIQFEELMRDELYMKVGKTAIEAADRIREALRKNGYELYLENPTNQVFTILENTLKEKIAEQVSFGFWEIIDETHTAVRFATSWCTKDEDVDMLIKVLEKNARSN